MHPYTWVIVACWAVFIIYWIAASFNVKRDTRRTGFLRWAGGRVLIFFLIALVLSNAPILRDALNDRLFTGSAAGWAGACLAVLGVGFAVWARIYLGRDWSSHPDIKEDHELVTGGPYAYVRHPIYTGIILALVGTALAITAFWAAILIIVIGLFLWRIPIEERYMMRLFPDRYPAYRARTKRLIPFVW